MSPPLTVLIATEYALVRALLHELLDAEPELCVVGEAQDGRQTLDQVRALRPEVVVIDVSMPDVDGIEAARRIRAEWPSIVVVGLSSGPSSEGRHPIEDAGAEGDGAKGESVHDLVARLLALHKHRAA